MSALAIEVIQLFIVFLQGVVTLLERLALPTPEDRQQDLPALAHRTRTPSPAPSSTVVNDSPTSSTDDLGFPLPHTLINTAVTTTPRPTRRETFARRAQQGTSQPTAAIPNLFPQTQTVPSRPARQLFGPTSPSAWRSTRTPNSQLAQEYQDTGICGHYFHETRQPRLPRCPICLVTTAGRPQHEEEL